MPKKSIAFLLLAIMTLVWSTLTIAEPQDHQGAEEALCIPMGTLPLDPPDAITPERTSVAFPHSLHFKGYSCDKCHHTWESNGPVKTCMTSGCHDQVTVPADPLKDGKYTKESMKYYKYAYHNMCRDCHKELKNKQKDESISMSLPTGCVECHPKH